MEISRHIDIQVEQSSISSLNPYPHNARTHSEKQIHQIAASIREFGFTHPVLIDQSNTIIAGHGRAEAAKRPGITTVPTIRVDHVPERQKRAYIIADNKLAQNAGWDPEILVNELQYLSSIDLDFDLKITGFETAEIDLLIDQAESAEASKPENAVLLPAGPCVTAPGDLWLLGDHRIVCDDARDNALLDRLMQDDKARVVLTDPPYNVHIDGHVCGLGSDAAN